MVTSICPRKLKNDSQLIKNLHEKKRLLESGDAGHEKFRTALVLQGGVFLGSYGGGIAWGLEEAGMSDVFDYVVGVSTGSVTGAYFLSGQMALGAPIFYEDLVDGRFLNFRRIKSVVDLEYLIDIFKTKKRLDTEKILTARSKLIVPVTDMSSGKSKVFSLQEDQIETITLIKAAMTLPGLFRTQTEIDGTVYCDGVYSFTNPVSYAVDELGCTDVVVVTNRACDFKSDIRQLSYLETLSANTLLRNFSPEFRKAYTNRRNDNGRDLELMWGAESEANIGLLCRDVMPISRFSQNRDKIEEVVMEARAQAVELFGGKMLTPIRVENPTPFGSGARP